MSKSRGRPPHEDQLTPAEWKIVDAVRHGLSNPEIARLKGVSIDAVKYHVANALHKLGFSSRLDLRSWPGVPRDSALAHEKGAMTCEIKLGALGQVARTVKDVAAAREWYSETLGLCHLYSFGNLAFFDCGGIRLFLSEGEERQSQSVLYFRVENVLSAHAQLSQRGVVFVSAPHMIHRHADGTEEWMAFFSDNEGRPLAIMSQSAANQ